jgi:phage FluMu protein Com
MMHYTKRCRHCNTVYAFQASGEGCFHKLNDETYCPDCMKVINEALKLVSKKFKKIWVETEEEKHKNGFPLMRRVYVSLFNLKKGTREINDAFDVDDKQYCVKYWSDTPEIIKIEVLKELNIGTGEITGYWKDY